MVGKNKMLFSRMILIFCKALFDYIENSKHRFNTRISLTPDS